jgi:CubicO group peptidase (beta-lactamase class C family)
MRFLNGLLLGCLLAGVAQAQRPDPRIAEVENSLMPYVPVAGLKGYNLLDRMRYHRVPGVSIAVIQDYKIAWAKAYGLADTLTGRPVTTKTPFSAGSISKLVAAVAALKLVEEGKMDLDKPINAYLTSWKLAENDFTRRTPVTLRMLLSHRGGTSQSAYFGFTPDKKPLPSVVDILSGKPGTESRPVVVNSEPNREFRYSGGGYLVVQQAMMDVTGQDFASFVKNAVFRKLGMTRSTFAQPLPERLTTDASWAYSGNAWFKGKPYVYPQQAAAGLYTTPTDLASLLIALQNSLRGKPGLLSPATVRAMVTPLARVSDGFYREDIGVGAFLLQQANNHDDGSVYFGHNGVNAGFLADAWGSVAGGNGVVILLNDDGGASELSKEIRRAVAKVYGWTNFLPQPLVLRSLPDSLLNAYVGRYRRGADEVVAIRREGKFLLETINGGGDILGVPIAPDTIALTDYTAKAYFSRGPTGRVDSLRLEWDQRPWPRLPEGQYLPNELLRLGRIAEAVEGYRRLDLNESQLTYMAYEFINRRPANLPAAEGILGLAKEKFPQSAMVYARYGELFEKRGQREAAIEAYQTALKLNPEDEEIKARLAGLRDR